MPTITIGTNIYREKQTPITIAEADRLRHMYMIGKTGVGKSTLFQSMALQDIQNGGGVCFIDPHGEAIDWLLARIPHNRLEDVVLFDPSDDQYPTGLNLLEANDEQQKSFVINEVITIFYKLFDPHKTGIIGPQFEHWLRNGALTVMAKPAGGSLLEIPKLFTDPQYEAKHRKYIQDPLVLEFWTKQMAKTSDFHRSEMLNYFSSKFGHFANNSLMRNILGQKKSTLDFDSILAQEKILLINLSKGRIGELNAHALGLIVTAKLQAAILKRAELAPEHRYPFYLYVDEFQNVVTDTFSSMLSESRKYGLAVHLTNQYFSQLPKSMQDAILGNMGTILSFEIGMEDADIFAKEFYPIDAEYFTMLKKFHFYIKLMIDGKTSKPFSGVSIPNQSVSNSESTKHIKTISRLAYGYPKLLIDQQLIQSN